jgi:hypothetical protein
VIEVTGGSLSIESSSLDAASATSNWNGIRVRNSSLVTIIDATISNADYNSITDSNLFIYNSIFNVPANSYGLLLRNDTLGLQTEITNTEPQRGFYGVSNLTSIGLFIGKINNPVIISDVDFQNLKTGIYKSTTPAATDLFTQCRFYNCGTGIQLSNNGNSTVIQQCSFASHQGRIGTGIHLVASSPTIFSSNFTNLHRGILTEFALLSGSGTEASVSESNFYNCETGIESRSSNHRLNANYFNRNNIGLLNHAGANLNLSYNAHNVMMSKVSNIKFYDSFPYESTIQLFNGHNDFYHLVDNGTGVNAIDFSFDTNYFNFPLLCTNFKIDASRNWFQNSEVLVNDTTFVDYLTVGSYDPSPSMPAPPPENDRLFIALDLESASLYEQASYAFRAILDDELEDEKSYYTSAIDGIYRCTFMIPNPSWELTDYFDAKALQHAIDEPTLSAIYKDYLTKVFVLNKDFQSAVDLIQLRIDNSISEIDSLRAVLDLEIVLQLAAMEEAKCPLTTKYVQYQYPDTHVFDVMHSNNWNKYKGLLHKNEQESMQLMAPFPKIQSNYPNPFNPSTTIVFSIPESRRVRVSVYNIKGQKVKDLLNDEMMRGSHRVIWDGKDNSNRSVSSGIYFIRLESMGKSSIRKAMLLK